MTARYTAFEDETFLVSGDRRAVVREINARLDTGHRGRILVFDDETGRQTDLDLRETDAPEAARGAEAGVPPGAAARNKGRPRLGVVSREVTLLPRHWDWLRAQPGGASAALRLLVDEARRTDAGGNTVRQSQNAAYAFMSAIGGDLPGFEEATRALFAGD